MANIRPSCPLPKTPMVEFGKMIFATNFYDLKRILKPQINTGADGFFNAGKIIASLEDSSVEAECL
jgi:hypothetical protein